MATEAISRLAKPRSDARLLPVVAVGFAGVLAAAVTAWAVARSPVLVNPGGLWIWRSLFVASYVAVGAYTWWRRPESRLGPIVAAYGFLYSLTTLNASGDPLAYTLGMVAWAAYIVYTGYVFLCFPRGRLASRLDRGFMLAWVLSAVLLLGLICALSPALPAGSDFTNCGTACPHNALQVVTGHAATGMALISAFNIVFTVAAIGVAMLVFEQARSPSRMRRRALTPLAIVVLANIVEFVASLFLPSAFPGTRETLKVLNGLTTLAVPAAIFAGQLRGDAFAAVSLGQIALREGGRSMTAAAVQRVIGEALGDPTLRLAVWASERGEYVDVDGRALELPRAAAVPGVTRIIRDGEPLAVLIHNPILDTDSDVVEGLAASSLLLLENTRLVEELRASRLRIVQTADRERKRLEQDLHDGAQQRLIAVQIKLRLAQARAGNQELSGELEAIRAEAVEAIDELRSLAHGIYPLMLQDRGLPDALRSLALRSPIPISVRDDGIGRCAPDIEAAIYFCSREAIQNSIKHAGPDARVTVDLGRDRNGVHFSIADDGIGADTLAHRDGVGVIGMRDRLGAVGGKVEVTSAHGNGTTVRGTAPAAPPDTDAKQEDGTD